MIRPICRDKQFLAKKSEDATLMDMAVANDLLDTLRAHKDHCVGMAANMIGVSKNIIAVHNYPVELLMFNPKITKKTGKYVVEEGCLSLDGQRRTVRYQKIEVEYYDSSFTKKKLACEGFLAEIIQHEIDHCHGIII